MKAHLSLMVENDDDVKLLHITDTHLFADENCALLGVNTCASFEAVIQEINKRNKHYDLIVATGDFVQDGSNNAYLKFTQVIKPFAIPCVWLPGNHDDYDKMETVFNKQGLPDNDVILLGSKWLVVMLNSQVKGEAYGLLSEHELTFLSSTLASYPERYAIIFLHHHPIMSGCKWLDQHCLKNHADFAEVIRQYPNIKSIGWGHIHQTIEAEWQNCKVFSTPSTCVQFRPSCQHFSVAEDAPGWREIMLMDDGEVASVVECLDYNPFQPDSLVTGY